MGQLEQGQHQGGLLEVKEMSGNGILVKENQFWDQNWSWVPFCCRWGQFEGHYFWHKFGLFSGTL